MESGWFDKLTMSGLLTIPLILSWSKDAVREEPPDGAGWFDRLTMSGLLTVLLILSLSKGEVKEESPDGARWFNQFTMSGLRALHRPNALAML